jgi:hypothetical protein
MALPAGRLRASLAQSFIAEAAAAATDPFEGRLLKETD